MKLYRFWRENNLYSAHSLARKYGISTRTARRRIKRLLKAGILTVFR